MIGTGELLIILFVVLILFGGKRLPELAKSIGAGLREFKKACNGLEDDTLEKPITKKQSREPVIIEVDSGIDSGVNTKDKHE